MDECLYTVMDYSEGQREAARRVLIEVGNLLQEYRKEIMVIGGWVPDLHFPEDAYDIFFCIKNYSGDTEGLARLFEPVKGHSLVLEMCAILRLKFASTEHAGPKDVADFLGLSDAEEVEQMKRDAYERINLLLDQIER